MKSITKKNVGVTELLIVLPLFVGLLCAIAWVGFFMIQKSKMEKHAWELQTRKTYRMEDRMLDLNPNYKRESNFSGLNLWHLGRNLFRPLPHTFKTYLELNETKAQELSLRGEAPNVIEHFYSAAFQNQDDATSYHMKAEMISSGRPMNDSVLAKQGLWLEAMNKTGFNYPLQMLGIPEVSGIPLEYLGKLGEIIRVTKE